MEEIVIFLQIVEGIGVKNIMDISMEEYYVFEIGFKDYQVYFIEVREGCVEFDGEKLVSLIDSFMFILYKYLINEVDILLFLKLYDGKCDFEKIFREEVGKVFNVVMKDFGYRVSNEFLY